MGSGPMTREVFYMLLLEVIVVFFISVFVLMVFITHKVSTKIDNMGIFVIRCSEQKISGSEL